MDELLIVSGLVAITRNTFAPEYSVMGGFDDGLSDGAMLLYTEEGPLEALTSEEDGSEIGPTLLIPTSEVGPSSGPQLVLPGTRLTLVAGDLLAPPVGTSLFHMNRDGDIAVDCLVVTIFPGQVSALLFGTTASQLEVNLGVETVRELAPPVISAGKLTLAPGASIPEHQAIWPRVVFVESGSVTMAVSGADWQSRRAGAKPYDPAEAEASDTEDTLNQGDAAYVPPGATVSVNNGGAGPVTLLSLAVVPPAGAQGTPSP